MIDLRPLAISVTVVLPGFVRTKPSSKKMRPAEMDLEVATARIHRAILERKRRYAFPFALALAAGFGRMLPARLYERILSGRGRNPNKGGHDV
jgi:short-subunit dehydrogenase